MMQSPKNRKGKKLGFSAPVAAMFLIAAVLGMQFGCTDNKTAPAEAPQTGIEKAVYGAISGVVHDLYMNQPLKGVNVTLQGIKQKYTATTDKYGQFRINHIYLGTVSAISGGAGDGWSSDSTPQRAEFDFPLFFQTKDYAPWKEHVALSYEYIVDNGTIVVPSGTFFEVGRTGLMPYVQSFTGKVWAGSQPAKGVTVMLDHRDWPYGTSDWPNCLGNCPDCDDNGCNAYPDYVELVNSFAVTNDDGVFTFDLDDHVVAYDNYELIVYPYDVRDHDSPPGCVPSCDVQIPENEDCVECDCFSCVGDGLYEYDSTETGLDLEPKSYSGDHYDLTGYKLDAKGNPIVVQTGDFAINLKDAENNLEVIYCSLQSTGNALLPANYNDFKINVTFNRPLTGWAFQILKDRSHPIAIKVEPTSSAHISFDITPLERLNVSGNTWRFNILSAEDYTGHVGPDGCYATGGGSSCRWDFNVAGGVPPVGPTAPWVDVNTGGSQNFQSTAPDRRAVYRLYKDFGPTSPSSVLGIMQNSADMLGFLNIAFNRPAAAVGVDPNGYSYYAFVRDTKANTAWVQLPVQNAYDDGQQVEGYIYLPSNFRYAAGGDNNYLGDGNHIQATVLAVNEDGAIDPTQLDGIEPGSYLDLSDTWGPMIVGSNTSIYGSNGTSTTGIGALYDETANIAFHEVLDGSVAPVATTASANFSVQGVYMDEKHTFVTTQFQPAITATLAAPAAQGSNVLVVDSVEGFYPGDELALYTDGSLAVKTEGSGGPYGGLALDGYDQTTNILILDRALSSNHAAGEVVALLGPMQRGVKAGQWKDTLDSSTQSSAKFIAVTPDILGKTPSTGSMLIVNGEEIVNVVSGGYWVEIDRPLHSAYVAGTRAWSAMPGFGDEPDCLDVNDADLVVNTVLLMPAEGGAASITVEDGSDVVVGDWLKVGADDYVRVASVEPGTGTEATITFAVGQTLHQSYPARLTTVVQLTVVTTGSTMLAYPMIELDHDAVNLLPGKAIQVIDPSDPQNLYATTVLSVWGDWVGVADLAPVTCEPLCQVKDFPDSSPVIAPLNTRTEDSIQVNVTDTSGNTSLATDKDGDGQADFDELELWSGGMVK